MTLARHGPRGRGSSATRRCSCPTTSTRASARSPRWPRRRGHHDAQRRRARARLRLPPSRGARPRAGHHRPALRGPARGRARRRVEATRLRPLGHPDGPARVRVDRMIEHTAVLKGLFADGPVQLRGRALHDHRSRRARPAPTRRAARRSSSAAARPGCCASPAATADIVGVNASIHSGEIDAGRGPGRAGRPHRREGRLGAGGRRRPLRRPRAQRLAGGRRDHRRPGDRRGRGRAASGPTPTSLRQSPLALVGTAGRDRPRRCSERRDRWGYSYHVIPGDKARDFAPVVADLTGT